MGRLSEAGEHEGHVACVLADGRIATGTRQDGVSIEGPATAADKAAGYPVDQWAVVTVPWSQVARWQVRCACGWSGRSREAYEVEGTRDVPSVVEDDLEPEWLTHVAPHGALRLLAELVDDARALDRRIEEQVHLARFGGASWTQVGAAVGMTKQGAQQRWGTSR